MLHYGAQGIPYDCFVREDTTIPFMVMPDAIKALLMLEEAPASGLTQLSYNVTSFSPSASDIHQRAIQAFPDAKIGYKIHQKRQAIVDSWPQDVDDSTARKDWDWQPDYDMERAFNDYLIPAIKARYTDGKC